MISSSANQAHSSCPSPMLGENLRNECSLPFPFFKIAYQIVPQDRLYMLKFQLQNYIFLNSDPRHTGPHAQNLEFVNYKFSQTGITSLESEKYPRITRLKLSLLFKYAHPSVKSTKIPDEITLLYYSKLFFKDFPYPKTLQRP